MTRAGSSAAILLAFAAAAAAVTACGDPDPRIPEIERPDRLDAEVRDAIAAAASAVRQSPDDAEAWGELGLVFQAHEFYEHARECYERAAELDASRPEWPYRLAALALDRGEVDDAQRMLEIVTSLAPERLEAWVRLGDARLVSGDAVGAERAFTEAIRLAPGRPWGHAGLGRARRERGDLAAAAESFERALELEPRDRGSAYALATTLKRLGRDDEAERALARYRGVRRGATMAEPWLESVADRARGVQSRVERATRLARDGNFDEAEGLFREALAADPAEYTALVNLATILLQRGQPQDAAPLFERATSLRPDASHPRVGLATALVALGETERARAQLEIVLVRDPAEASARELMARISR